VLVTVRISRNPWRFGQSLEDTTEELGTALAYIAGSTFFISVVRGLFNVTDIISSRTSGDTESTPLNAIISSAIDPVYVVFAVSVVGVIDGFMCDLISKRKGGQVRNIAAHAYMVGFYQMTFAFWSTAASAWATDITERHAHDASGPGVAIFSGLAYVLIRTIFVVILLVLLWHWIAKIHKISHLAASIAIILPALIMFWVVPLNR
jgi:hypothetical protein